jgi:hypothetical protein
LLVQYAPAVVSDAFVSTRLAGDSGRTPGTLGLAQTHLQTLVERASPHDAAPQRVTAEAVST